MSNNMPNEYMLSNYICERYYIVTYKIYQDEKTVKGLLLNYQSGNIVLLSEDGIRHIKFKDIVFMSPTVMKPLEQYSEEYQIFLKHCKDCENMVN